MVTAKTGDEPLAASLRDHVLEPIREAQCTVDVEYGHVDAERRAFAEFKSRVAAVDTLSTSHSPSTTPRHTCRGGPNSRSVERVRSAFRETVMGVDHYDRAYDETLDEHATAELSAEAASVFRGETAAPFTEMHKTVLTAATERAIDRRDALCDALDDEAASLETGRATLAEVLDSVDGPSVPPWYRGDFTSELDDIATHRQETVHRRDPRTGRAGHDLCQYLYGDRNWTYPVLTAVARVRDVVVSR